ncbi:MAG: PAS domain-containing protein [Desulfamplus sp.]|nr:PAS domain-containing protein [Desulfamplus sp.]
MLHDLGVYQIQIEMQNDELIRAQTELSTAKERYFDIYDQAPVGYCTLSYKGTILETNLTASHMFGLSRGEVVKKHFTRFIFKDDRNIYYGSFKHLLNRLPQSSGEPSKTEVCALRMLRKDSEPFWARLESTVLKDKDGSATFRVIIIDITECKKAENRLKDITLRYKLVMEGSQGGIWDWDVVNSKVNFSPRWKQMRGYADDEISDNINEWKSRIHPVDLDRVMAAVDAHFRGKTEVFNEVYRIQCKDGTWRWIIDRGKALRDRDGRVLRMAGSEIDITEQKEMKDALSFLLTCGLPATGEDFFESLARYLSQTLAMEYVCIDSVDKDGLMAQTVAVYNCGKFETNVKYSLKDTPCGEVINSNAICCYPKEVRKLFPNDLALQDLMAESYFGTTLLDSKGEIIGLIAIIGYCELKESKKVESLLKIVAPRAAGELERRKIEEEHERLQSQLNHAQKLEAVGRLAGGVAHDFNNMLGVILGYTEIAIDSMTRHDQFYDEFKEIQNAAQRSVDIVRHLLAFARKQTISPKLINLNDSIEGMIKILKRLIGEDITLNWLPADDLWNVCMDPSQVDQILANLCVNARDAIEGVGNISISTDMITLNKEWCDSHQNSFIPGDYVQLTVSDDGSGIDKEDMSNIFEPFYTTKEIGKGTGLGLSTVYGILNQNHCFIDVDSQKGRGTTFTIYIPRYKEDEESLQNSCNSCIGIPAKEGFETILVVEDEPAILNMVKLLLEKLGYNVLASTLPSEAIEIVGKYDGTIDLLLTDVIMPEMTGRLLLDRINIICPNIKTLFMSGYTADIIAKQGVLDDGVHFIHKPFSINDLSAKVREALKSP